MFVDSGLLHSGADQSHRAGEHAQDAAAQLARGPLAAGMFGDFTGAEAFHGAISAARAAHVKTLQAHHETLTALGSKAYRAAAGFTDMDERNASALRAVQR